MTGSVARLDVDPNKIEPPAPIDKIIYELPPEEYSAINMVPTSLNKVLDTLVVGAWAGAAGESDLACRYVVRARR